MSFVVTPAFRVLSCPFVVQILPRLHRFVYFVFFVVKYFFCHSCPLVVQNMPEPRDFVYFVYFVVNPCLWSFVSIRVHSWFLLSPPPLFSCLSCFSWFDISFAIRVHSCPLVVLTLSPFSFSCISCFSWLAPAFRVHSWFLLSPFFLFSWFSCFSWFHSCISWFNTSCPR